MSHVLDGFLKAAGIPLGLLDDVPMMLGMARNQQLSKKKKDPAKVASGDMVDSPENRRAYERRMDMGLGAPKKWARYKSERRKLVGLGRDVTPSSGYRDNPQAENATPTKADTGTSPGSGGMP